jgi:hypothetical protein
MKQRIVLRQCYLTRTNEPDFPPNTAQAQALCIKGWEALKP